MKKELKIYLFRHGQSTYNKNHRFTGWDDPNLTPSGINNAKVVAVKLKSKRFQLAIHTSLKRSKRTLKEVLKYHPECSKVIQDDRMIERNYGSLNGSTHEDFIDKIGKRLLKLEVFGDMYTVLEQEKRKKLEKFLGEEEFNLIHRGYNMPPPGGESFAMVEKRVQSFIKDLIKKMKKEQVNVAICAHGNSIRMFRKIMEKSTVKQACSWKIPYDKVFEYSVKG